MSAAQVDEHRTYVLDKTRVGAFERAIEARVRPGSVVVDLGTGTGLLALLACRAGAARVYAIEETAIVELARALVRGNGFADRVTFVRGASMEVTLPERADVVVADQIGPLAIGAGFPFVYDDARERFLRPNGAMIPGRVDLFVAPVERAQLRGDLDAWRNRPSGFEYAAARDWAVGAIHFASLEARDALADAVRGASIDVMRPAPAAIEIDARFVAARAGRLDALGLWFEAELAPGVVVSTSPCSPHRIRRDNALLAADEPIDVAPGDRIAASIVVRTRDEIVGWTMRVESKDGATKASFARTTLDHELLTTHAIAKAAPAFVPRRTALADAELHALSLMDGTRTIAEIERAVAAAHPSVAATPERAAKLVARIAHRGAR